MVTLSDTAAAQVAKLQTVGALSHDEVTWLHFLSTRNESFEVETKDELERVAQCIALCENHLCISPTTRISSELRAWHLLRRCAYCRRCKLSKVPLATTPPLTTTPPWRRKGRAKEETHKDQSWRLPCFKAKKRRDPVVHRPRQANRKSQGPRSLRMKPMPPPFPPPRHLRSLARHNSRQR